MSLAMRRHHRNRLMKKREFYHSIFNDKNDEVKCSKYVNTPTPCSCWMCGNPRKYGQKTLQELRNEFICEE